MKIKIEFPDEETADAVCKSINPAWEGHHDYSCRFFDDYRDRVVITYSETSYFVIAPEPEVSYEDLCAAVQNRLSISEVIDRAIARRRSER